ncbi:MAG: beta-ketoacyl-ACP synthase III [Desulfobacteria bacterium]|jgi:3-oxoacyl-[acyl-carrier-protein] synthase-3|nr:ketoacyl-ACP synthase III [Deltaproteobacteria bacterium]MDL1976611.1 ketoacyl-ACP synthase III [Deltaproteobacteria bacterium]OEU51649.1 MAG: 3-oxoacyl-ACP synthase [Desulfobacterales bacterium C00003106]OEU57404.1 MAG: 3-oxoacyl-ACP synthase [Desulfobacterales bacterium C00003104]
MFKARIIGTGSTTPKRILTNTDLENIVDTSDEWITRRTGIKERRISQKGKGEKAFDLAADASLKALEMAGMGPDEPDLIILGTITPDRQFPSVACMVQDKINAVNANAFDVSAGCSGFLYALSIAENAIATGGSEKALVIGAELLSSVANWEDRSTCVLLGDGAGAVVLGRSDKDEGILSSHLGSDGRYWKLLYSEEGTPDPPKILEAFEGKPYYLAMEGNKLFKKAVKHLADVAMEALRHNNLSGSDVRLVVPHQANIRIIEALADRISLPMEKVYTNIHKYGNTSSASIPIALDEANREGMLRPGDIVLLVTFGAGLTWGASVVRWSLDIR